MPILLSADAEDANNLVIENPTLALIDSLKEHKDTDPMPDEPTDTTTKDLEKIKEEQEQAIHTRSMYTLSKQDDILPHVIWQKIRLMQKIFPKSECLKRLKTALIKREKNPLKTAIDSYSAPMTDLPLARQIDLCFHGERKAQKDYRLFLVLSDAMHSAFKEQGNRLRLRDYRHFERCYKEKLDDTKRIITFFRHKLQAKLWQQSHNS